MMELADPVVVSDVATNSPVEAAEESAFSLGKKVSGTNETCCRFSST